MAHPAKLRSDSISTLLPAETTAQQTSETRLVETRLAAVVRDEVDAARTGNILPTPTTVLLGQSLPAANTQVLWRDSVALRHNQWKTR
jgi:hypothetical protein